MITLLPYEYGTFVKVVKDGKVVHEGTVACYTVAKDGYLIWVSGYKEACTGEYLPETVIPMTKEEIKDLKKRRGVEDNEEEDDTPKILKDYEDLVFDINTNAGYISEVQEQYSNIKRYIDGHITLESLAYHTSGCPINSCFWCNNDCDKCDLYEKYDDDNRCTECWRRCLEEYK